MPARHRDGCGPRPLAFFSDAGPSSRRSDAAALLFRRRSLPVDLLVLDLALPDGDGLELLQDVVRRRPESRLPSLRLSGDDSFRVVTHVGQATLRLAHVLLSAPLVRRWSPRGAARRR
jgi:CheY-like chemotaxis protein